MATVPTLANYNANPWAQSGAGTYGAVPGAIGIPPSIYSQVGAAMPNLSGLTSQAGNVIGSEMSGGVRNVRVNNCTFIGTDIGLRFKSTRGRGGVVENILISNVRMVDIPGDAINFNLYYGGKAPLAITCSGVISVSALSK